MHSSDHENNQLFLRYLLQIDFNVYVQTFEILPVFKVCFKSDVSYR